MGEQYCVDPAVDFQWKSRGETRTLTATGEDEDYPIPPELLPVLDSTFEERDRDEIVEELAKVGLDDPEAVFADLVQMGVLTSNEQKLRGKRNWFEHKWHQSLLYHLEARDSIPTRQDTPIRQDSEETSNDSIELPEPDPLPDKAFEDILLDRRTSRYFDRKPISATDLSSILYYWRDFIRHGEAETSGVNEYMEARRFPFQIYLLASRVDGVSEGAYRYDIEEHALVPADRTFDDSAEVDRALRNAVTNQPFVEDGAVGFLLSIDLDCVREQYRGSRIFTHLMTTVSAHAHRLILLATAFGYDIFQSAAIDEPAASDIFGSSFPREITLYAVVLGKTEEDEDDDR